MKTIKILYIIIIISIYSCNNHESPVSKIEWKKIANTKKPVTFCQIDSISKDEYIISYSYPYKVSGGYRIVKMISENDSTYNFSSLAKNNNERQTVHSLKTNNEKIGFIRYDFNKNELNSSFFLSHDTGKIWKYIETPYENIRNFIFLNDSIIVFEGNINGTGQTYKLNIIDSSWKKINTLKMGYKSFYLLNKKLDDQRILAKGSKKYSSKYSNLIILNEKNVKELVHFNDFNGLNYIEPISKNRDIFGLLNNNKIEIYSLNSEKVKLKEKIKIPATTGVIKNIYLSDKCYIITAREKSLNGKVLSWISSNEGRTWIPYNHEKEYKLIYNDFGELFMIDSNNNINAGNVVN